MKGFATRGNSPMKERNRLYTQLLVVRRNPQEKENFLDNLKSCLSSSVVSLHKNPPMPTLSIPISKSDRSKYFTLVSVFFFLLAELLH